MRSQSRPTAQSTIPCTYAYYLQACGGRYRGDYFARMPQRSDRTPA